MDMVFEVYLRGDFRFEGSKKLVVFIMIFDRKEKI